VANDLYFIGIGGAVPAVESVSDVDDLHFVPFLDVSNKVKWEGYPYNDQSGNPSYSQSDNYYLQDLTKFWEAAKLEIEENNTTSNIKFVLLTHNGPFYSNTTILEHGNKCIYMGSKNLQQFLKENKDIFLNIHGHTHDGTGMVKFTHYSVINPGSLLNGDFAIIKLKRNHINQWTLSNTEFINL